MNSTRLEPRLHEELKALLDRGFATGKLMTSEQIQQQAGVFREGFGPAVLRGTDGDALLRLMHGRQDKENRCLAYWLEFKNDDEFAGNRFGGIGGGSSMKYGLFQRQSDDAWMGELHRAPQVISRERAIEIVRRQRDELVAGSEILSGISPSDITDETYARAQTEIEKVAPELSRVGWAHKYWFLIHTDRLDDYHSPRYQRFHLIKLLQMPPDQIGILDAGAARFNCAGRFVSAARELGVPIHTLCTVLNERDSAIHRYWRVGTTAGGTGENDWGTMGEGGFVSIGWHESVLDLSQVIGQDKSTAKTTIRDWLHANYPADPRTASRKAGEILNFAAEIAENDLVLACDGLTVLGVGRVRGSYEYDPKLSFPHKREVEWLLLEPWQMPESEGLRTTVFELGRHAVNLLALEERLFRRDSTVAPAVTKAGMGSKPNRVALAPLDPFAARIDGILQRKGQVILYGPPGTGKTYRALNVAKELAARRAFNKGFAALTESERSEVVDATNGESLVRLCAFHPNYGYEDFIEGLKPKTINGHMVFEPRDGIFKRLCADAAVRPDRHFFLVMDEINRGDVPRIFGELITLIEHDKRGTSIILPNTGSSFVVPRNVFLIGTMNTADRSISLLDTALRRRFGFVELMPDSSLFADRMAGRLPLGAWLDALNTRLRQRLKRDARNLQIGHAYLLPPQPITSIAEFARILRDDIIPLLEEYCYDDFGTLKDILGSALVDTEAGLIRDELFAPNREDDLVNAIWFEEMGNSVLAEELTRATTLVEPPSDVEDDGEDKDGGASKI